MSVIKDGPKLYKDLLSGVCREVFGNEVKIEFFEECIKIAKTDGSQMYISYNVREPFTKTGINICDLNDITVTLTDADGKPFYPQTTMYIYAVLNEAKTAFCRWYVIDRKRTLELYRSSELYGYEKRNENEGSFAVFNVDDLVKRRLMERYKRAIPKQTELNC